MVQKSTVKNNKKVIDNSSDEEVIAKVQAKDTKSKAKTKKQYDSDEEVVETKGTKTKSKKLVDESDEEVKTKSKSKKPVEESDEEQEPNQADEASDEEQEPNNAESSNDESDDEKVKKTKEKKKESFDDLTKKLETLRVDIKTVDKEISELSKELKTKEKLRNDYDRQLNNILKLLSKTHSDEVNKARKEKPKRKGNVNGGFNKEQPVPKILAEFLELDEGASMARPKVMSALNNKFNTLGLKKGQITTLDKATARALGLGKEGEGREIKFTEFQSFLASFYPKKTEEKEVEV
jgi:chromosome segregation ATPase